MKTLEIPYVPALDSLGTADAVMHMLEEQGVRRTINSANWHKDFPYTPLTSFTTAHGDKYLYIDFFTRCNFLRAENFEDQSPVSEDSCVEFFVQPVEGGEYWNFEWNCIGTMNASHRLERPHPTRLSAEELARVKRHSSCGDRPFCELEGIFTWNLVIKIPLDLFGVEYKGEPVEMRGNFYKCASKATQPHYLSWNPIETPHPDFHRPEFFGKITLL